MQILLFFALLEFREKNMPFYERKSKKAGFRKKSSILSFVFGKGEKGKENYIWQEVLGWKVDSKTNSEMS